MHFRSGKKIEVKKIIRELEKEIKGHIWTRYYTFIQDLAVRAQLSLMQMEENKMVQFSACCVMHNNWRFLAFLHAEAIKELIPN